MVQLWKTVWLFLRKITHTITYDAAIPLLGTHPKELEAESQGDVHTPMSKTAFLIIIRR